MTDLLPTEIPTDFSDYMHYDLREEKGKNGVPVPVYQSRSTGILFAEDATPLVYFEGRLLDAEMLCEAWVELQGPNEEMEKWGRVTKVRKEAISRVLEAAHAN